MVEEINFFIQVQSVCKAKERAINQVVAVVASSIQTGHGKMCIELREKQVFVNGTHGTLQIRKKEEEKKWDECKSPRDQVT